jgi:hypothetical protein
MAICNSNKAMTNHKPRIEREPKRGAVGPAW